MSVVPGIALTTAWRPLLNPVMVELRPSSVGVGSALNDRIVSREGS
ncbi:hypothetical protein [Variovorax sp. J22R115]|nr:hypothetical protein [Variovorax sp. J22R115]MDM0049599.1 hypothetical protein [Variovorax sp. J22R115]